MDRAESVQVSPRPAPTDNYPWAIEPSIAGDETLLNVMVMVFKCMDRGRARKLELWQCTSVSGVSLSQRRVGGLRK